MTTATVSLAAYTFDRLEMIEACVQSVLGGSRPPDLLLVVVDNNPLLTEELRRRLPNAVEIVENVGRGLSNARNVAVRRNEADVVAFIDDDARAGPLWLEALLDGFDRHADIVAAGGKIVPDYESGARPLPGEMLWLVGSTYSGHRKDEGPISRPIGANMAFRAAPLELVGGFDTDFGVVGAKRVNSNEEIAVCSKLRQHLGPDRVLYLPAAVVSHHVPASRTTWRYIIRRSWVEGRSKAAIRTSFGGDTMAHDRVYASRVLPRALARHGVLFARERSRAAGRDVAIIAVVPVIVACGYIVRRCREWQKLTMCR